MASSLQWSCAVVLLVLLWSWNGVMLVNGLCGAVGKGFTVDLSPLTRTGAEADYNLQIGPSTTWYLNVCARTTSSHSCTTQGAALLAINFGTLKCTVIGDLPVTYTLNNASDPSGGLTAVYTPSGACSSVVPSRPYTLTVTFQCGTTEGNILSAGADPTKTACDLIMKFSSRYACGTGGGGGGGDGSSDSSSGLSGGWIFVIILLVVSFVYAVGGCVYKNRKMGASGVEMCPNIDFWRQIPGLVKDGCLFSFRKMKELFARCTGKTEYQQMPS